MPLSLKHHHFYNGLRYFVILAIILACFMPPATTIVALCGLLAMTHRACFPLIRNVLTQPVVIATGLLFVFVGIHLFKPSLLLHRHDEVQAYVRWLIFIPFITLGLLLQDQCWQRYLIIALVSSMVILAVIKMITPWLTAHQSLWLFINKHYVLSQMIKAPMKNGQPIAVIIATACAITFRLCLSTLKQKHYSQSVGWGMLFLWLFYYVCGQGEVVGQLVVLVLLPFVTFRVFNYKVAIGCLLAFFIIFYGLYTYQPFGFAKGFHVKVTSIISNIHKSPQDPSFETHSSTGRRVDGIHWALINIKNKPWLGYGMGTFNKSLRPGTYTPLGRGNPSVETAYFLVILNIGLIGFVVFMSILVGYWYWAWRVVEDKAMQIDLHTILLALLVGGCTFPLFYTHLGLLLYLIAASIISGNYFNSVKVIAKVEGQ